ncbi:hypothetical protein EJF18_40608 [Clavispora lusitaniae]|uniref:Uncharacterized protein n=1 Tax=Clavispora lusitaniae TaxID=36911 RepID=A0ACD0WMN5_CLALS|nr:hypothetical protein EJF14_40608 [Clavispora lusitaniae]QFZ34228.1 hypothetical protein EJF16_40608 [Clavispora lusitaniae]QFZ39912.1 hypothetical protein EJF15_40608 [Clavispora lusitaniae]QFZ45594.1 hypothetical protein EJF18_40608 [Clavispora lusitaniae]QFZ51258.1 hypothetical protein EJF17_40608 [Clavispora lusitaniae]
MLSSMNFVFINLQRPVVFIYTQHTCIYINNSFHICTSLIRS